MVVAPDRSQRPSRSRTPLHSVQGSVPLVTVTVDEMLPPAAAISAADEPLDRMASSAHRFPAYTGWVWASISPGVTRPPPRFSTWVHVNDVVDHSGNALGQLGRGTDPGDPVVAGHDGGVAQDLRSSPQPTDIGQQPNSHRRSPPGLVILCAMSVHLP